MLYHGALIKREHLGCKSIDVRYSWLEKPGWGRTGRDFPLPAPLIPFPSGVSRYITKMCLFTSLELFFSSCHSCIGGFGPFETLGPLFSEGPRSLVPHLWNHLSSSADSLLLVAHFRINIAPFVLRSRFNFWQISSMRGKYSRVCEGHDPLEIFRPPSAPPQPCWLMWSSKGGQQYAAEVVVWRWMLQKSKLPVCGDDGRYCWICALKYGWAMS